MFDFLASSRFFHKGENLEIPFYFLFKVRKRRMLFSSFWLQLSFFLVSFSVKLSHWFCRTLCGCQLPFYLTFDFSELFYALFTFDLNSFLLCNLFCFWWISIIDLVWTFTLDCLSRSNFVTLPSFSLSWSLVLCPILRLLLNFLDHCWLYII